MYKHEEEARELVDKLPDEFGPEFDRVDAHGADVTVRFPEQSIPMGTLECIGKYGDLRIEGVRDGGLDAVVQL